MEKLKGIKIEPKKLNLTKMGDLLFHEGPILSHFVSSENEDYFFLWVDQNKKVNRWLAFSISSEQLAEFFQKKITTRQVILEATKGFSYLVDIDDNIDFKNIFLVRTEDLPKSYLPPKTSKFNEEVFEDYAKKLKSFIDLRTERELKIKALRLLSNVSEPQTKYRKSNKKK